MIVWFWLLYALGGFAVVFSLTEGFRLGTRSWMVLMLIIWPVYATVALGAVVIDFLRNHL